jgi:hypothetical protein
MYARVLYIETFLTFKYLCLLEERVGILVLRIGTNDCAVNGGDIYTASVL